MELQCQIERATNTDRKEALKASIMKNMDGISMEVTYHPDLPSCSKNLREHLPILHVSEKNEVDSTKSTPGGQSMTSKPKHLLVRVMQKLQRYRGS